MIYLDSAATSFYRPPCVAEAVAEAISSMGNCSRGAYKEALTGARVIFETRVLLSEMFHGDGPEQVAFTANSTESLNIAIMHNLDEHMEAEELIEIINRFLGGLSDRDRDILSRDIG